MSASALAVAAAWAAPAAVPDAKVAVCCALPIDPVKLDDASFAALEANVSRDPVAVSSSA